MSKDDAFGSGGKTVIRPNPGGGTRTEHFRSAPMPGPAETPPQPPVAPAAAPPPPANPGATVFSPRPVAAPHPVQPYPPAQPFPAAQPPRPAHASPWRPEPHARHGMPQQMDDWMRPAAAQNAFFPGAGAPQPVPQPVEKIPLEVAINARDGAQYSAANPITAAAAPLLILLGRLRLMIVDMQAVPLMNYVANSIREFERKVSEAGVPEDEARIAKYALCGTADDIVQNLPGTDRQVWLQYSMLAQFFGVRTSGVGFFEELGKILANPAPRYNLLELMHACLSLGFEGQYRSMAGGDRDLQRIRREVYETLRHLKARNDDDISPRWQGMARSMTNMASQVPLWAIASVLAASLVGVYILLRLIVGNDADALAAKLLALHPPGSIGISRAAAFEPIPVRDFTDQTQLQRIRAALSDEIAGGALKVEKKGSFIVTEINNLLLFASGSAEVRPEFEPLARRIAAALDPEPGPVSVIGHTDNVPLRRTSAFSSNQELSLARAGSVEGVLAPHFADSSRLVVSGKGEAEPIANNATAEGRALNRRVEVMIREEGASAAGQESAFIGPGEEGASGQ